MSQHLHSRILLSTICTSVLLLTAVVAEAETVQFPEDELAAESVLPVFDQPQSVKGKLVSHAHRFEVGVGGGYNMIEPFFNPVTLGANVSHHFSEDHGVNVMGQYFMSGTQSYANQKIEGSSEKLNMQYAPGPKYLVLGSYQFTGYYGKISITKEFVMNLSLYGLLGAGVFTIGDKVAPTFAPGLGQKFFFGENFGLRFDMRLLVYQGPDVVQVNLSRETSVQSASRFPSRMFYTPYLSFSMIYLFPGG